MARTNPFRPGRAVHPGMFAGRLTELKKLERILNQTKNGNAEHFMIEGVRGIGKTSLLTVLGYIATGLMPTREGETFNYLTATIDLQEDTTYRGLLRALARQLKKTADDSAPVKAAMKLTWDFVKKLEVGGVKYRSDEGLEAADDDEALDELVDHVREIAKTPGYDGLLLMIDEADKPAASANLGRFVKLFETKLSRKQCDNVSLGLAGLPILHFRLAESHASSPRIFEPLHLSPLSDEDRKGAVRSGIAAANETNIGQVAITDGALEMISEWSDGFPAYIQEFAYCAFDRDTDDLIDEEDVRRGADGVSGAYDRLGAKYFKDSYWVQVQTKNYRTMLRFMAASGTEWVTKASIRAGTGLTGPVVTNGIAALTSRNIIISRPGVRGQYRLPSKAFATWLAEFADSENLEP
jgi:AAA ATPase domain